MRREHTRAQLGIGVGVLGMVREEGEVCACRLQYMVRELDIDASQKGNCKCRFVAKPRLFLPKIEKSPHDYLLLHPTNVCTRQILPLSIQPTDAATLHDSRPMASPLGYAEDASCCFDGLRDRLTTLGDSSVDLSPLLASDH